MFQPRSILHAGHVAQREGADDRLVLIAFSTIHAAALTPPTISDLRDLGFQVPSEVDCHCALHGSIPGDFPRMKQLSIKEALQCNPEILDKHDVVAVWDEPIAISDDE